MRKKFTMLLAALFLTLGTAWAQTAEVQGSTTVEKPEHQYVMKSGHDYWMAANTAPTKHKLGRFAFFEVTETSNDANDYKIYSIDLQKWVSYEKAGSYSNGMEFAKLVDSQENAQPWSVEKKTVGGVGYYQITPYNNNGVAAKYMNWFGGIDASYYSYDDTKTVGLWQSGAGDDAGSRWTLAECLDFGSISDGGDIATTWAPSSWWKTNDAKGSNVLEAVMAVETTQYSTGNSNVMMRYMHMQVPAGRLDVTLSYQTGNNRLDIVGVDLLNANGEVVVSDYHFGYTGNAKSLNTYTLPVETAGSYSLRYWVTFKSQPNNSNGNIAIAHTSVAELKEAAKAELDKLAKLSIVTVGDAKTQVDAVDANANPNAAINAILVDVKKSVDGKNVRFTTYGRNKDGSDITAASNGTFFTTLSGDAGIWTLKSNDDGTFKMYNFLSNLYLGVTAGNGSHLATCSDFAAAGSYTFNPISENRTNLQNNGNSLHADGWGKIVQWNPDHETSEASIWTVVSCDPIAITREQYDAAVAAKAALPYAIQQAYGLVKDASKYSSNAPETDPNEKSSCANLLDNTYSTYFHSAWSYGVDGSHYLQAEVSEEVKDFCFYFKKRHSTNNNRPTEIEILGSADGTEFTKITTINSGLPTNENEIDYFSPEIKATENVKYLRFVVKNTNTPGSVEAKGNPFFHFSEFYIFPAVSDVFSLFESYYSFGAISITDNGIVEAANGLINAKNTLALSNIKKEIQAILNANKDNHEEVPALGKYSTAGYDALEAAYEDLNATQESLENAIAAFEASLNRPVYFITSAWDGGYPAGSAIYYDGTEWMWKKANKFDCQMWMTIPGYTNGDVPSVDAYDKDGTHYGFYDYFTGTKMRNLDVQIVAVPSWADAYNLQYSETVNNAAMHAQSDKKLVGWNPATISSNQASAWKIEYLGSSYSLGKLSKEKLEALANLQAAFDSKSYLFNATYGDGLGQYKDNGNAESIYNTLMEVAQFLSSKLNLFADEGCTIGNINALTDALNAIEVSINMPEDGKYYRIYGANNVIPSGYYITCHTNNDGGRIALTAEANASTIYYYKDGKLQAYLNGKYIATSSNHYVFDNKDHAASDITFAASPRVAGAFTIKSAGVFLHYKPYYDAVELDRCSVDEAVGHDWYLQEVTMEEINKDIVTDLNQVSDQARYKIYGQRGFMYVDAANGIVKSTYVNANKNVAYSPVNEYHNFAIVKIGGKSYLYSVGAKKFVVKSGDTVALLDYPDQEITIEPAADQNTDYDWLIKMGGTNLLNITDAHNSGIYTNYNTEDPGNRWALRKVGKFDPDYASNVKKVVVNYNVEGQTFTKTHGLVANSEIHFSYAFATVASCKVGEEAQTITNGACSVTVQDNMTIDVEIDEDLPFEAARAENNIPASAWLYLQMNSNNKKYIEYLSENEKIEWADASVERAGVNTHTWALVGNVVEGFKLVNYAATTSKALKSTGSGNPAMDSYANGTAFVLANTTQSVDGGFCLQYPGGQYLNAGATLQHWGEADAGSTLVSSKSPAKLLDELNTLLTYAATVVTIENDKTAALQIAIDDAQNSAATDYATVEGQITALNTAIDNVIKAEVGAGLFRLKNSASGLYMTIVTPEAAAGIQIKEKATDATKQAFYIAPTAEVGVYNIKSTENYFMASSGAWNYGAYQTANEAGRAHKVEYLGNGKYALKTLLGYAGPNKNATSDGSPLYSNHTADNNGREWELEALVKSNITYIYKWNDQTIESEVHENVYEGLAAPATAVTLPFGFSYDNAALPTTKGAGNQEVVIACTLSLPFQYAATYEAVETNEYWYYLKFDSNNNYYLHHADGQNYIALDSKAVDKTNKDVYSWGFVGDPINGFKIVNRAAGSTKILSSSTTMAGETGAETWPIMTVAEGLAEGNNTLWIPTASDHADGGFFLAQKDHPTHRMNNRGSKLAYWTGGAGAGSTFVAVARPFGPVAELEALLVEAEKLKTEVDGNIGAIIGKYSQETAEALTTAVETAQTKVDDETATTADVEDLQDAIDATKMILPTPGTYYQFHSAYTEFTERRALFSNGNTARWKILNNADKSFYWLAEETAEGNIVLKNAADSKYLIGKANNYTNWTVASTSEGAEMTVKILGGEGEAVEYAIILAGRHMHAANSSNGEATESNIVSWETNKTGSCSSWYIVEAELPSFFTVTYKFNYQGDTKYTQTEQVGVGGTYPEMNVFLPYEVTSDFKLPTGTVQAPSVHEFELTVNKTLPFETGKWYYAQMHADYTAYVGDDEGLTWWNNTYVATEHTDNYLWKFVGDLWSGYKMVNKATGRAIHSTGNGDASLSSEGTAFIASNSDKGGDWFCLKYPDNAYYLNANAGADHHKIEHWDDNDAGSSILLTEYKTYTLNIAAENVYSTYYSDVNLLIPADVEVYIATELASNYVALEQVEGVLPAHTGVLLKNAGAHTHNFVTSAAEPATKTTEGTDISVNHFVGTTTKTLIEAADKTNYYVLAKGSKGVGLYKAKVNKDEDGEDGTTHFYNNANKVYLPVVNDDADDEPAAEALVMRFGRGQGTTEIELPTANGQQPTVVYDLQGRRVLNPTKGMYIVNGKKVLF